MRYRSFSAYHHGIAFAFFILLGGSLMAQDPKGGSGNDWSIQGDPLGKKAFVKNKGQFDHQGPTKGTKVLYGTDIGDRVLFTEKGLFFRIEKRMEEGLEAIEDSLEEGKDITTPPHYVRMTWENASDDAELIAEKARPNYYTYGDLSGEQAKGYERLIYKDLYPGIDVIYEFPEEKRGFKYRIVARPGADISKVRMKYHLPADSLKISPEGDLKIGSRHGRIVDHAPSSSYAGGNPVDVSFERQGNTVSFHLQDERDPNEKLVIDPWTITPSTLNIPGTGTLIFDVDEDNAGNVYVSGGDGPYKTAKISPSGALVWTYTWPNNWSAASGSYYYSELAVLPMSGSIFIGKGFSSTGTKVMKISSNGTFIDSSSTYTGSEEIWKMVYNRCTGQLIGYGGGTSGSNNNMQLISDTNIATASNTAKNFNNSTASCCNDIGDVVMDGNGDFYALISTVDGYNVNHDEYLEKGLAPNYNSLGFSVSSGYEADEGFPNSQIPVVGDVSTGGNGSVRENMLALNNDHLYSYDGRTLKAWNKSTGTLIDSVIVSASYSGDLSNLHEGIDVDPCNNVYVGGNGAVHIYKFDGSNFSPNGSITTNISGQVYDVMLEFTPKRLIVGGEGFVTASAPLSCKDSLDPHLSVTHPTCGSGNDGSISVDSVSGSGGPFNYQWSTGDTTASISGLSAGSYGLTVLEESCSNPRSWDTTITLVQKGDLSIDTLLLQKPTCDSPCSGSIDISYSGATPPLQFSIDSGASFQSDSLFSSLCQGTYDVYIEDSACSAYQKVELETTQGFEDSISVSPITCNGACDGVIDISLNGGTPPFQFSIDSGASFQSDSTFTNLCADTFEVLIQDSLGCTGDSTLILDQPGPLSASIDSIEHVSCTASSDGYVALSATGGTKPYDFQWGPNAGNQTGPVIDSMTPGSYQCVVTDSSGCTDSISVTIDGHPALTLSSSSDTTLCNGGSATLSATANGGATPYTYIWNGTPGGGPDTTVSPNSTSVYTVSVLDSADCQVGPDSIVVSVIPPLDVDVTQDLSICNGDSAILNANASGGNGNYSYSWSNGSTGNSVTVSPNSTSSYSVTVTGDCPADSASDSVTVSVDPLPEPAMSVQPNSGCVPLEVELTNNTDSAMSMDCIWAIENGDTLNGCNGLNTTITEPGCRDITLSITSPEGCSNDSTFVDQICAYPLPDADFDFEPQKGSVLDPTVEFMNRSEGAVDYLWEFGGLDSTTEANPTYTFPNEEQGSYRVCLEAISTYGCKDSTCKEVRIEGEFLIYVPNAFTPDGDGINDGFYPVIQGHDPSEYQFEIYDRWGERIFKSSDPQEKWKGHVKGSSELAKPDVYVWKLKVRSQVTGEQKNLTGHVTLVR